MKPQTSEPQPIPTTLEKSTIEDQSQESQLKLQVAVYITKHDSKQPSHYRQQRLNS